jgi:hypothetical protein
LRGSNPTSDVFTISRLGNVTSSGDLAILGNTSLGNSTSDLLSVTARLSSSLVPAVDNTWYLGSSALRFAGLDAVAVTSTNATTTNLFATNARVSNLTLLGTSTSLQAAGTLYASSTILGNSADVTRLSVPAQNQMYDTVTSTFGAGYRDQLLVAAAANFASNQSSLAFNGLDAVVFTYPGSTTTLGQLNGGSQAALHYGSGLVSEVHGALVSAHNDGGGIVTDLISGRFVYSNGSSGSITNAYGIQIESPQNDGSNNNITNAYGLYIQNQNRGTNAWQLYSSATTTPAQVRL